MDTIDLPDDIRVISGMAFTDILELYQDDAGTEPVDLTGITFEGEIRESQRLTSTLLGTMSVTILGPPKAGRLQRHISSITSAQAPIGGAWLYIKATPQGGETEIWFRGKIVFLKG